MSSPASSAPSAKFSHVELSFGGFDAMRAVHFARSFPPHFHHTFAIGVVEEGACVIRTRRGEWTARPGSILAFSPGEVHAAVPCGEQGYTYRMIYPSIAAMDAIGITFRGAPAFRAPVIDDERLSVPLREAQEPLIDDVATARGESLLVTTLRQLASGRIPADRRAERVAVDARIVAIAHEYMEARLAHLVKLDAVAAVCGVSPFHLIRIFRRAVGVTPIAYLIQLRVLRAQKMLSEGSPIVDAAYSCGFSDQSHLTRTFRDVIGVPPGRYLRSVVGRPARPAHKKKAHASLTLP